MNNELKQQRHGAGETSRNDKLRVAWEGLGNTRAGRANTAKRAPNMLTHHRHVRVHVCTSSIQCEFQTNTYQSSQTTSSNNNVTAPLKPQETTNYELLGKDWATRAPVAQTLQSVRQPCSRTTATCAYTFAQVPSSGNFNPTPTSPSATTSSNNNLTAPLKPQEATNYELLGKDWATRAPVAQTLQSVRQTCSRTTAMCAYTFAQVPLSG